MKHVKFKVKKLLLTATNLNETLESLFNLTAENVTSNLTKITNVGKSFFIH